MFNRLLTVDSGFALVILKKKHLMRRLQAMKSRTLKKYLLSATAVALSAGSALAADLPSSNGPPVDVPLPPIWTGFYAGLNAGWSWGNNDQVSTATTTTSPIDHEGASLWNDSIANVPTNGFIGGGQIGYNYQFYDNFIVGAEADVQGAGIRGEGGTVDGAAATATSITKHTDWLGTVRGRLGYLVTPTLLVYSTGGLAYGGVEAHVFQTNAGFFNATFSSASIGRFQDTRVGWSAGGGLDWMFMPNCSLKSEFLYYDVGTVTFANSPLVTSVSSLGTISQSVTRIHYDGFIVRAGLNYHF
jgi:outer membrane immunogenic protein